MPEIDVMSAMYEMTTVVCESIYNIPTNQSGAYSLRYSFDGL